MCGKASVGTSDRQSGFAYAVPSILLHSWLFQFTGAAVWFQELGTYLSCTSIVKLDTFFFN